MISRTQEEFIWGALVGGAIGAAAALVLTPVSGPALRKQVVNGINKLNGTATNRKTTSRKPHTQARTEKKIATATAQRARTARRGKAPQGHQS